MNHRKNKKEMKKNILKATLVAAFALLTGHNIHNFFKTEDMSDLALANVEALADDGEAVITCSRHAQMELADVTSEVIRVIVHLPVTKTIHVVASLFIIR